MSPWQLAAEFRPELFAILVSAAGAWFVTLFIDAMVPDTWRPSTVRRVCLLAAWICSVSIAMTIWLALNPADNPQVRLLVCVVAGMGSAIGAPEANRIAFAIVKRWLPWFTPISGTESSFKEPKS